jgi:uncharacterized protein YndB with AHSA1/START domain
MKEPSAIHNTFVLERTYTKPTESVFAAFADPSKKRRWYADNETIDVEEYALDFREDGREFSRYRFREGSPFPGVALTNEGIYLDIVRNQRIVVASRMMLGDRHISASLVTIEFLPTETGTDMIFTHQGIFFEGSGGPEMREAGWNTLFEKLAKELAV